MVLLTCNLYCFCTQADNTTMEEACRKIPLRNSPRIAAFVSEESVQFFILCEQKVLCKAPSLQVALFLMFSAYYVFNLEYPKQVRNVLFFFQDYILSQPDSFKRPSPYISVVSDIKRSML